MPANSTVGVPQSGKISWFGGPHDSMSGPTTSSGLPVSYPGISTYNQATKGGYWLVHMPNGRQAVLKQTDIGPAPWTGRNFDFTYTALPLLGYHEGNFPTDANISAVYLGKSVPKQYAHLIIGPGQHPIGGQLTPGAAATTPGTSSVSSNTTGGGTDWGAAITDALLNEKPINISGKVSSGGGLLSRVMNNVSSGAYTTPIQTSTVFNNSPGGMKSVAKNQALGVAPGAGDVNPLGGGWSLGRTDMGVDANARVGTPIRAINDSVVTGIIPNWFSGQPLVAMRLTSGPNKGKLWYVAEQIHGLPHVGQVIGRGQTVATYAPSGTGIEIGWAGSAAGATLAQTTTGYHEGQVTPEGVDFRHVILRA